MYSLTLPSTKENSCLSHSRRDRAVVMKINLIRIGLSNALAHKDLFYLYYIKEDIGYTA